MDKVNIRVQVLFEDPFWIALVERTERDQLSVAKVTFGPEPKDYDVYSMLLARFFHLSFSPAVETETKKTEHVNPKRMARQVRKELKNSNSISTKSQAALSAMRDENKLLHKERSKEEKRAYEERQYELRQWKKKQKHKGR